MMYVEGNPLSFTDTTGNSLDVPFFTLLYQYSKLPDDEGKQASSVALMYYQHQQVKRAGGRACPASGAKLWCIWQLSRSWSLWILRQLEMFLIGAIVWYGRSNVFRLEGNTCSSQPL
jgi:hypothetical protein